MEGCCSSECVSVIHLPEEEQKAVRRGIKNGNKIFKKGKSPALLFKNNIETPTIPVVNKASSITTNNIKIKKHILEKECIISQNQALANF